MTAEATVGGVALSWEAAAGAVRYELATWWDEGTGWQMVGGDDLAGTTYTHTDVAAGTTYYYSIRAVNAVGETSDWLLEYPSATALAVKVAESSAPAPTPTLTSTPTPTATATAPALPSVPELTARATVGGVELSWGAAAGAVRYELATWWDEGTGWQYIGDGAMTGTTYTHTDVAAGTTYYYSIRAVNEAGETSGWLLEYPSATALAADQAMVPVRPVQATTGRWALMELQGQPGAERQLTGRHSGRSLV